MAFIDYWNFGSGNLTPDAFKHMEKEKFYRPDSYHYKHKKTLLTRILRDFRRDKDPLAGAMWLTTVSVIKIYDSGIAKGKSYPYHELINRYGITGYKGK